jgi:hypothetical protein
MALAPAALAVGARARASRATEAAGEALGRAWLAAAEEVASQAANGITVAELASRLKIDPERADKLLTQLAVHDRTRIDVDDDAEVRYSVTSSGGAEPSKFRVASSEDAFRALEQAEAEAETAAAESAGGRRLTPEEEALETKRLATSPFGRGAGR